MGTSEPDPTPEPKPQPAPTPVTEAPQWAKDLMQAMQELPGKLTASVTDDDKRGIAESVYDLFDSGGAFNPAEPEPKKEPETVPKEEPEPTPKKHGKLAGFATWFAGER